MKVAGESNVYSGGVLNGNATMKILGSTPNTIKLYNLFFLVTLLTVSGCFPLIHTVRPGAIQKSDLGQFFSSENTAIMVIPTWGKFTGVVTDDTNKKIADTLWLGDPVFTDHDSLDLVHEEISFKISTALIVGPGGAVARDYAFYGHIVVWQTDGFVLLRNEGYPEELTRYSTNTVGDTKAFTEFLKTGDSGVFKKTGPWWGFLLGDDLNHSFSYSEQKEILDFISAIKEPYDKSTFSE